MLENMSNITKIPKRDKGYVRIILFMIGFIKLDDRISEYNLLPYVIV